MMKDIISFNKKWIDKIRPTKSSHKYNRGVASFVMGSNYPGACLHAAKAASEAGAGYIKIHVDEDLAKVCRITWPSFVFISYSDSNQLVENLNSDEADAFSIGSGWSESPNIFKSFVADAKNKIVLDGGLLNQDFLKLIETSHENLILTPHEGELKKITGFDSKAESVDWYANSYSGVLVAKGGETVVAQNENRALLEQGSPYLAKAGTGDVLAGLTTSFLAQGLEPLEASKFAVFLHSYAAERLGWELSIDRLIIEIGKSIKALDK